MLNDNLLCSKAFARKGYPQQGKRFTKQDKVNLGATIPLADTTSKRKRLRYEHKEHSDTQLALDSNAV